MKITKPGRDLAQRLGVANAKVPTEIARLAIQYIRVQEELCSGPRHTWSGQIQWTWSEKWQADLEAKEAKLEERIAAKVQELGEGYGVTFSGDPRGACVYITTPDKRSDDWGGRGVCARLDD